jgi:hypothetical protein
MLAKSLAELAKFNCLPFTFAFLDTKLLKLLALFNLSA